MVAENGNFVKLKTLTPKCINKTNDDQSRMKMEMKV